MEKYNIMKLCGTDFSGRPVITILSKNLPPNYQSMKEEIISLFLQTVSQIEKDHDYVILYINNPEQSFGFSAAKLLFDMHNSIEYAYRKNIKALYIMFPSFSMNILLSMLWFLSSKFRSKIIQINDISELSFYMKISSLNVPMHFFQTPGSENSSTVRESPKNPLLGIDIKTLFKSQDHVEMPRFLETCISKIKTDGLDTVGIFRTSPSLSEFNNILERVDRDTDCSNMKVEICALLIKKLLYSLPSPILDQKTLVSLKKGDGSNLKDIEEDIKSYLSTLGEEEKLILKSIFDLCDKINENSETNKMNYTNLAIVFTPNLVRKAVESEQDTEMSMFSIDFVIYLMKNHKNLLV
ncbi:Rho GTPase-activating protein 1 [Thelohanellus kitauei]|uniref:Rho GTPase-activating protein 1 n=1 Tax=Thelohanellus kitauei TaxID=669202 RepID=A0A0C2N731_THEKT|nr:Rho GTPase-activating protein 1 [Thelohanellus kitauei]